MNPTTHSCGAFEFRSHSITDVGRVRQNNEDALIDDPKSGLFGVCDGLGGHAAGEVASAIASRTITEEIGKSTGRAPGVLGECLELANQRILREQMENPSMRGMGTTVSVVWISGKHGEVWVLHLGDSRVYHLRDGSISQLTDDHSPVYKLYQQGELTKDQIRQHPQKNLLERSLGITATIDPDIFQVDVKAADRLLICTDGLSDLLLDHEIETLFKQNALAQTGNELVAEANRRGGLDNITIAQVQILEAPSG